jgi:hypothetical protein
MSLEIAIPHRFEPRHYQLPPLRAFDSGYKRGLQIAHRRAGKDKTAWNMTIKKACERRGTYDYAFPTFAQAKKAIWDGMDKDGLRYLDHVPPQLLAEKNETEMQLTLVNGSIIQLLGTDKVDRLMSTNPVGIVFSEWSLHNPRAWEYIRPILRENGGWAYFVYTPRGKNHGYKLYQMAKDNPDWFTSILTVDDTGVLTPADIEAERREGMSEEMIQQEYYCSFEGSLEGAYYSKQIAQARREGRITVVPYDPALLVETWWDIGVSDSTAIWFTQTVGQEVRVFDYLHASGESIAWYAEQLHSKGYVYGSHNGPHDLAGREWGAVGNDRRPLSRIESAKQHGVDFRLVPNITVQSGIDTARGFFARCVFDAERCEEGLNALESYQKDWDDKARQFKSYPRHDWSSHGSDAFRYLAVGHRITVQKNSHEPPRDERGEQAWMAG